MLYGGYHRVSPHDPETYVMAVTAVLAHFDDDVIREVTDPLIGIATKEKFRDWPPNAGQLKAYCDEVQAYRLRIADYSKRPRLRLVGKSDPGNQASRSSRQPDRAPRCARLRSHGREVQDRRSGRMEMARQGHHGRAQLVAVVTTRLGRRGGNTIGPQVRAQRRARVRVSAPRSHCADRDLVAQTGDRLPRDRSAAWCLAHHGSHPRYPVAPSKGPEAHPCPSAPSPCTPEV